MVSTTRETVVSPIRMSQRIGSLIGLSGLVVGLPIGLVVFHAIPSVGHIGHLFTDPKTAVRSFESSLGDTAIANIAALLAWLGWLWLVLCVVVEILATRENRPAPRLPVSRHIQSLVAALVGTSLTVLPLGRSALPMRLLAAPTSFQVTLDSGRPGLPPPNSAGPDASSRHVPEASIHLDASLVSVASATTEFGSSYVVHTGDTLWSIAERELGSPLQWRTIADLNYGRPQPDGRHLTDAHWIFPGWILVLPVVPIADSAPVVERANGSVPPPGMPVIDGMKRSTGVGTALPSPLPSSQENDGRDATSVSGGPEHSATPVLQAGTARKSSPAPVGVVGYSILGAGVLVLLEKMRRVQRRHRPRGMRIALPDSDLAQLEQRLRVEADPQGVEIIDLGLRSLVLSSLRRGTMPAHVALVRLGDHGLEVILDPTSAGREPPPPFTSDGSSTRWFLPRDQTTLQSLREDHDAAQMDAPFPSLVTIGRDDTGLVMVDLEQAASLDVNGTDVPGLLEMIAIELATSTWTDQVDLILVGFDDEFGSLERVNNVPTIAEVLPRIQRRVRERRALLASVGRSANWEIRWLEGGDAWDLGVVICSPGVVDQDPDGARRLIGLAGDGGAGLAVVLGSPTGEARWSFESQDGRIEVTVDGASTSVSRPAADEFRLAAGVGSLLNVARQLEGVLPTDPPYDKIRDGEQPLPESAGTVVDEGPPMEVTDPDPGQPARVRSHDLDVEVRILGPVEIVGAARPFTRAWAVELVVYLVMHRNGASSDQWATALWPDRVMAPASLHSTASAARRSLGTSATGDDHLPRAHGRLTLAPTVGSDWNRFVALSNQEDPMAWRDAIELIRGRPFEGLRAPDWVLLEGIASNVEAVVVDLVSRYAEFCLSAGDPSGAEWAARQGLRVSAYDERLYRILLRAADAAGNPAGVESTMAELVHLVADDVEPFDAVHPETLDLYRMLSRRPPSFVNP